MSIYYPYCILLALALNFIGVSAQAPDKTDIINKLNKPVLFGEIVGSHEPTAGSPFFIEGWSKGDIHLKNGEIAGDVMIQYNGFRDRLYWLNPDTGRTIAIESSIIAGFTLDHPETGELITFRNLRNNTDDTAKFVQILVEDEYSLYVERTVEATGRRNIRQEGRQVEVPVLQPNPVYYIIMPDDSLAKVSRIRSSLISELFPEKEEAISAAIVGRRLRLRTESDLIDVIKVINEL